MKLYIILFLTCLQLPFGVCAEEWHKGFVILKNEKILRGEIGLRADCDVVIFRNGDAEMVYPAHRILYLSFFDQRAKKQRTFISLVQQVGGSRAYELFEVLLDGEISVVRKELSSWQSYHMELEDYEYFVYMNDELVPLNRFRRKVYRRLLQEASGDIEKFVQKHRLNIYRLPDIIRIINQINKENNVRELAKAG